MTYTPIFQRATDVNKAATFDANAFGTVTPTFTDTNSNTSILDVMLAPLPNLLTTSKAALINTDTTLFLDPTSFDAKYDSASNYNVNLTTTSGTGTVKVTEVTNLPKGEDLLTFGNKTGTLTGAEVIEYNEKSGGKLVVAHNYAQNIVKDTAGVGVLHSVKSDVSSQVFTGANNVASVLKTVNRQTQNLVNNDLVRVDALSEAQSTHSATVFMNSNHNLVQTNNYDQAGTNLTKKVSLYDVYALNHVDVDTNPALAHSLSYSKTDYDASATSHIRTDKLNFRDSTIAIAATQVNDIIKQVFSGNLAVISDNFALNTKLSTDFFANVNVTYNPTLGTYDPLTQKATLDNLFLTGATSGAVATTTSFRGTVDADTISIRSNAKLLTVDGLAGNDTIYGWIQNDSIVGGDGSDVITGRQGADTMTGGKSGDAPGTDNIKDKFVIGNFDSGITVALADTITDFTVGIPAVASIPAAGGNPAVPGIAFVPADSLALGVAGTDKNFVSAPTAAADFAAALINAGLALKALKVAGENGEKFAYENDGANGYLFDDVNGDGVADQVIILTGAPVLNFADIVAY